MFKWYNIRMTFNNETKLSNARVRIAGVTVLGAIVATGVIISTDSPTNTVDNCFTGADANSDVDCRIVGTIESLDTVWKDLIPNYTQPGVTLYPSMVETACGIGETKAGPFYCSRDQTVYIDSTWFDKLVTEYGANKGPLAEEYVVAHEVGHHIQALYGVIHRGFSGPTGPDSLRVRTELQADCYAGIWAKHAPETGYVVNFTEQDIKDAMSAAAAVGDDRIQQRKTGQVSPEKFGHGTAEQRQKWFMVGYNSGQIDACNTYDVETLN